MSERYEISWSRAAVRDLEGILDFLDEETSVERVVEIYEELSRRIATLAAHPRRCRRVPGFQGLGLEEHRELILSPYRVFFPAPRWQRHLA